MSILVRTASSPRIKILPLQKRDGLLAYQPKKDQSNYQSRVQEEAQKVFIGSVVASVSQMMCLDLRHPLPKMCWIPWAMAIAVTSMSALSGAQHCGALLVREPSHQCYPRPGPLVGIPVDMLNHV